MKLRLIGDVHTNRRTYLDLIDGADYSLQVGDLDIISFDWLLDRNVDSGRHKFVGGNHDNYDKINDVPHNLGDFGVWSIPNFGDIFFVRGAWSIDQRVRDFGIDWWPEEELSHQKCEEAIAQYAEIKPKFVVSHACPTKVIAHVADLRVARNWGFDQDVILTRTDQMLQAMLEHHVPEIHVFGHYHRRFDGWVNGRTGEMLPVDATDKTGYTRYVCLPINGTLDFEF